MSDDINEVKRGMKAVAAKTAIDALKKDREELYLICDNLFYLAENQVLALPKTILSWKKSKHLFKKEFNVDLESEFFTEQLNDAEKRRATIMTEDKDQWRVKNFKKKFPQPMSDKILTVVIFAAFLTGVYQWIILTARYLSWISSKGGF